MGRLLDNFHRNIYSKQLLLDGGRSIGLEDSSESLFRRSWDELSDGESKLFILKMLIIYKVRYSVNLGRSSSDLVGFSENSGSDNVKSFVTSSVSAGHFKIYEIRLEAQKFTHLGDSSIE